MCALLPLSRLVLLAQHFGHSGVVGDSVGQVFVEIINSRLGRLISFRKPLMELDIVERAGGIVVAEIDVLDDLEALEAFQFA